MSDFHIQRSQSTSSLPSTSFKKELSKSSEKPLDSVKSRSLPKGGLHRMPSSPNLGSLEQNKLISQSIDNIPSETLRSRFRRMPVIKNLGTQPEVVQLRQQNRDQQLLSQTVRPHSTVRQPEPLEGSLKDGFARLEHKLNKATLPHTKKAVLNEVRQQARDLVAHADPQSDFMFQLSTKSDGELKLDAIKSMGLMKDKYGKAFTPILSQHAQAMGEFQEKSSMYNLLREVKISATLNNPTPERKQELDNQAIQLMQSLGFEPQYRTTNAGLQVLDYNRLPPAPVAPVLDVDQLYGMLSSDKQKMVDAMVTGLREGMLQAPNRIDTYKTLVQDVDIPSSMSLPPGDIRVPETFQLNGREYQFDSHLATGGGGIVFNYRDTQSGEVVVLKKDFEDLTAEALSHRHVQSTEAIGMKGVLRSDDGEVFMVLEKAAGDLKHGLVNLNQAQGTPQEKETAKLSISLDILKGMSLLHQQDSSHNDMKGENVYIGTDGTAKIADFGESKTDGRHTVHTSFGTPSFNAPEVLHPDKQGDRQKNDVWGVGRLLYEIHTGQESPFVGPNMTPLQTLTAIKDFGDDPNNRVFTGNPLSPMETLINAMMHPDPAQRPTLEAVMQLSLFDGVRDGSGKALVSQLTA